MYVLWTYPASGTGESAVPQMTFGVRGSYAVVSGQIAVKCPVPSSGMDTGFAEVVLSVTAGGNGQVSDAFGAPSVLGAAF